MDRLFICESITRSFDPLSSTGIMFSGRPFEKAAARQLSSIMNKHGSSLSASSLSFPLWVL